MKKIMERSFLIAKLEDRMQVTNQSNCLLLYGKKGVGKSYLACSMGLCLDPAFGPDRIVFDDRSWYTLLASEPPPGSCILFDELAISASNRRSMSSANLAISDVFQTIRPYAYTVLSTCVNYSNVDGTIRDMQDFFIEVLNHDEGITEFKFMVAAPNYSNPKKPYRKFLNYINEDGKEERQTSWTLPAPPKWLSDAYDAKRKEFTKWVNIDRGLLATTGIRHYHGEPAGKAKQDKSIKWVVDKIMESPKDYQDAKGKWLTAQVQLKLGIGINLARQATSLLRVTPDSNRTHTNANTSNLDYSKNVEQTKNQP